MLNQLTVKEKNDLYVIMLVLLEKMFLLPKESLISMSKQFM
jgi:hypothetical protein